MNDFLINWLKIAVISAAITGGIHYTRHYVFPDFFDMFCVFYEVMPKWAADLLLKPTLDCLKCKAHFYTLIISALVSISLDSFDYLFTYPITAAALVLIAIKIEKKYHW